MDCIYAHTQDELEDKNKYDKKIKYLTNYILEYKLNISLKMRRFIKICLI